MTNLAMLKQTILLSFMCCTSTSALASGTGVVNSSALLSSGASAHMSSLVETYDYDTPQLLVLAEPESISFELEGIGLVNVEVDYRQQEGESRRLIKGRLRQGDVLLPYSAVTLIQSDQGLTGSLRTLEHSWLVSSNGEASDTQLLGVNEQVDPAKTAPTFLPVAVRALDHLITDVIARADSLQWQTEKIYNDGDLVYYQGQFYRASWWHHSQHPMKSERSPWRQVDS